MNKASEAIFSLKPVTFHYKNDKTNIPQFGLIAEEVAKVNPALIAVDKEGKPYSVRYQRINAMLLNEFLKEHRTERGAGSDHCAPAAANSKRLRLAQLAEGERTA